MATAKLRNVGGSVMMAIPPTILEMVDLNSGSQVEIRVEGSRLIIEPLKKPRYTLAELLEQCPEEALGLTDEDHVWLNDQPVGKEEL